MALKVLLIHSLAKLRPDQPIPQAAAITSLTAARNEYESFQVVLTGGAHSISISKVSVLFPSLASNSTLVHGVRYINITTVSNCDGVLGRWPDPLVPSVDPYFHEQRAVFPLEIPTGESRAVWIDVFVAPATRVGEHVGTVTVVASEQAKAAPITLPIALRVINFTIPSISKRYTTSYSNPASNVLIGRWPRNATQRASATSREKYELQKAYVDLGLMHRISFSDFLHHSGDSEAALDALPINWTAIDHDWGDYLAGGEGVTTPFGLAKTRPTSINVPPNHYPGPMEPSGGKDNITRVIDDLWHHYCPAKPTPSWGYAYWTSRDDCGSDDMSHYCAGSKAGISKYAADCGAVAPTASCDVVPAPPQCSARAVNNTLAIAYWRDVARHAKQAGWFDRAFDYTCDEPGAQPSRYAACKARSDAVHAADPTFRVLITAEKPSADRVNISDAIDVWVPIVNFIDSNSSACGGYPSWAAGDTRAEYDGVVASGKTLWWYQSCMSEGCASSIQPAHGAFAPGCSPTDTCSGGLKAAGDQAWPSYMIDVDSVSNRVMAWMSYKYEMQGELYWGTNYADETYTAAGNSSWEQQWLAGGNGDGSLTYPGRSEVIGGSSFIPIASQRLKHIRDGIEDLELMYALEDRTGSRDAGLAIVNDFIRSAYDFDHAPGKMLAARAALVAAVAED